MTIGTIGWPVAVILVIVVIGAVALLATIVASNAAVAGEKTKGKLADQYRELVGRVRDPRPADDETCRRPCRPTSPSWARRWRRSST